MPATDATAGVAAGAAGAAAGAAGSPRRGLLWHLLDLLLQQPSESPYLVPLASCIHKWVQASSVNDQALLAGHPGLIPFILEQLVETPTPPEPRLQVSLVN
jgi:hypothetical protein